MKLRKPIVYLILFAFIVTFYVIRSNTGTTEAFPVIPAEAMSIEPADGNDVAYYVETLRSMQEKAVPFYSGQDVEIEVDQFTAASNEANIAVVNDPELKRNTLAWQNGIGWVEWMVDAPQEGLYEIEVLYQAAEKSSSSVLYDLSIDGHLPFSEAGNIEFTKRWKDKTVPYQKDEIGNEIRSLQEDIPGWVTTRLMNYSLSSEPLRFHLTEGRHTLRFTSLNESMSWGAIRLAAPDRLPSYEEYEANHSTKAGGTDASWYSRIEAERYGYKSHPAIQTGSHNEPNVSPDPKGRIVYNVIDGNRWKNPGESISWMLEVPDNGWYELDVKYSQRFQGKSNVYRTLYIDGQVPFQEMQHYAFPYNDKLEVFTIGDRGGTPYRFYLEKGRHELLMVVDTSLLYPSWLSLQSIVGDLYTLEQRLRKLTGAYGENSGDVNRTWDMAGSFPDLEKQLTDLRDRLEKTADYLNGLNQNRTDATISLQIGTAILEDLLSDSNQVPNKLAKFSDLQQRIGSWMDAFSKGAMTVDYLIVRAPSAKPEVKEATFLSKIPYTAVNFVRTFYLKYDTQHLSKQDELEIWVGRGRDYVNLLQEMINQSFTPTTGIRVKVNMMPDANALTLSNAGGDQPDVALGLPQDMPVDYAMREAALDLTAFGNFPEVAARFHPGAMRSYTYKQGIYALPETQSFPLLFYRKSVMKSLGLEIPDTWEDVIKIIPALQENGMNVYHNPKDYIGFFYQHGAELYSPDGRRPGFDTEQAYKAFSLWTDLYSKYDLPKEVPAFFQHFKQGDIPMGVADFNTYIQLLVSAPEIRGDWGIAAMPGVKQADGTVARWAANGLTSAMILRKSERKDEAWAFLNWWTSADTQQQYGVNMESFFGVEYRWNTANMQAIGSMPWPSGDMQAIKEQNRWVRNVPFLPGGYFLGREMEFAWNRAVVEMVPPKDSLDRAYTSLEREMHRKQQNLKLPEEQSLAFPSVAEPFDWRGAQQ
ncbi:extracellular solute-binding protein [Paenibacillus mendelii]|uniref:Extracellular solute-binding protein n=1 Tax=Paenibacillus mendelii TaxID=206163 RepID=A0ABV6JE52_9BACL|nr:extracellular solute-binding protein [Paenibacillus mendelii]MCQ6563344.1 extracellular solute-binding protein [Paenibacillus mendelii]